jgi:hypothetical protein
VRNKIGKHVPALHNIDIYFTNDTTQTGGFFLVLGDLAKPRRAGMGGPFFLVTHGMVPIWNTRPKLAVSLALHILFVPSVESSVT